MTDQDINAMLKGADLTLVIQSSLKKEPISVQVPVAGFAAAYAKIKLAGRSL